MKATATPTYGMHMLWGLRVGLVRAAEQVTPKSIPEVDQLITRSQPDYKLMSRLPSAAYHCQVVLTLFGSCLYRDVPWRTFNFKEASRP